MAAVNYAEQYLQALSQDFPFTLHYGKLYASPANGRYRFVNSKTIEVPSLSVKGRKDANRDTIVTPARNWDNDWTPLTLTQERYWDTLVHPKDIDQTNMTASIGNITRVYNEEEKFPEMDSYLISKVFADYQAASKTPDTTALTDQNVLTIFDKLYQQMFEDRVPTMGLTLYIDPATDTLLKNAKAIVRELALGPNKSIIERAIARLDGVDIVPVPSDLIKTLYDFTQGATPAATAKQIHMFLVQPSCVITPVTYDVAALDEPCAKTNMKWYYYEESHEDVFILPNKANGVAFNVDA